jgi:hypothetical protein
VRIDPDSRIGLRQRGAERGDAFVRPLEHH